MLTDLIKIAKRLKSIGLYTEASIIDAEILKLAQEEKEGDEEEAKQTFEELPIEEETPPEAPKRPKEGQDLADLIKKISELEPYERWVYLTKANPDVLKLLFRPPESNSDAARAFSFLLEDEKKELNKIKKEYRADVEVNIAEYRDRYDREKRESEISTRPAEQIQYAAFQLLEPHIKAKVFLRASEKDKGEIIDRMSTLESFEFLKQVILGNLQMFKKKLNKEDDERSEEEKKEGKFGIDLKIKFMRKLARSTENVEESKKRVKSFYNLLSSEDKALLREFSRGGGAIVSGSPFGYYYSRPQEEPYEVETIREAPSIAYDPTKRQPKLPKQPPILPEIVTKDTSEPTGPRLRGEKRYYDEEDTDLSIKPVKDIITNLKNMRITTVGEIEPTDYCIFQLLPTSGLSMTNSTWIFRALLRTNLHHPDFEKDPEGILNLHKSEMQDFADKLEKQHEENIKEEIVFKITSNPEKFLKKHQDQLKDFIGDSDNKEKIIEKLKEQKDLIAEMLMPKPEFVAGEGQLGDCIVVDGDEARELLSAGKARFTTERWSGEGVYMPQFGVVSKPSTSDKYTSEALVESDFSKKVNPRAPTVFTPTSGAPAVESVSIGGRSMSIPAEITGIGEEVSKKELKEKARRQKAKREMMSGKKFNPLDI